jgi:hypothetical protein
MEPHYDTSESWCNLVMYLHPVALQETGGGSSRLPALKRWRPFGFGHWMFNWDPPVHPLQKKLKWRIGRLPRYPSCEHALLHNPISEWVHMGHDKNIHKITVSEIERITITANIFHVMCMQYNWLVGYLLIYLFNSNIFYWNQSIGIGKQAKPIYISLSQVFTGYLLFSVPLQCVHQVTYVIITLIKADDATSKYRMVPLKNFFSYIETSPLPVKSCKI